MVIEQVGERRRVGHLATREADGQLSVEGRFEQGTAMEGGQGVGIDGVENGAGEVGQGIAVAAKVQQAELSGGAEAGGEGGRPDVLDPQCRGDRLGRQAVQPLPIDDPRQLDRLGQGNARVAVAAFATAGVGVIRGHGWVAWGWSVGG